MDVMCHEDVKHNGYEGKKRTKEEAKANANKKKRKIEREKKAY